MHLFFVILGVAAGSLLAQTPPAQAGRGGRGGGGGFGNAYPQRPTGDPAVVERGKAIYGEDVCELDLSAVEESDLVNSGHLVIVPRTYLQLSRNYSAAKQGETFEAALPVEQEAGLILGGHIERADKPASTRKGK